MNDDLIRRSDAIKAVSEPYNEKFWDYVNRPISDVAYILKSLPAVERGTIEYCGGCKYDKKQVIESAPSVTVETDIDDYMKGYDHGMADAWKIAQAVFNSEVTLYEAMDVAKCMKGADDDSNNI